MRSASSKRPRRLRQLGRSESGESMVEFALVLPVLLLVLIGVLQFALVHHAQNVTATAVEEGARLAAAEGGEPSAGMARAREVLRSGLGATGESFEVTASGTGETVTVEAGGGYPLILPWLGSRTISIDASATMRKEGFRGGP